MADAMLLNLVLFLPVVGIVLLLFVPAQSEGAIRWTTFWVMVVQLVLATVLYVHYDATVPGLQFETRIPWIPAWGVYYQIGLDGYNILLVLLTAFLGPLVWLSDRVFLRTGDRMLFDGTLHGLAGLARRTAGVLSRVQNGNLHLYAYLVIAGMAACLAWSFRHG